jgi:nucleotidyltransferase/DNA polymerase involved in DNA repair
MIGLIDCNNFFVSCERLFRPDLAGKPVVVMSNNDGCAVAMSNEAKALGIKRGLPIYQLRQIINRYNVTTISGNHRMYGNISSRVMATIGSIVPEMDIYSIDEAFIDMSLWEGKALVETGHKIVSKVRRDVGIPTSLGIAPTKTLAKIAARFAKKYPGYRGVCIIDNDDKRRKALALTEIDEVWGIARRLGKRLRQYNINTALDFAELPLSEVRKIINVMGERSWRELNGEPCIDHDTAEPLNKQICTSRSYKKSIDDPELLKEAVADYSAKVARRLREQGGCAKSVTVFIQTNSFRPELPQHFGSTTIQLDEATDDTLAITSAAVRAVDSLFRPGYAYRRAGVTVNEIVNHNAVQQNLFSVPGRREKRQRLMTVIDSINAGEDTRGMVRSASSVPGGNCGKKDREKENIPEKNALLRILYSLIMIWCASSLSGVTPSVSAVPDTLAKVVNLEEVIVKPGKEHYSKKNNPAVDFVGRIRENAELGDPLRKDNYNFERYERITIALNDIADSIGTDGGLLKKFQFLNEYVDTSEVTKKPILPLSIKEKVSNIYNRKDPRATREFITGLRRKGLDDISNQEAIQTVLEDFFREINLYDNDITLLTNRFVSPLSKIGPDFYKYYLSDTIVVNNDSCAIVSFVPRNNATFGFVGRLTVALHDPTMFIRHASMTLSPKANVNFVKSLHIDQTFERLDDGTRLKTSDVLTVEFEVIPNTQGLYAQKYTTYRNHNFDKSDRPELYDRLGTTYASADAFLKDDTFWEERRGSGTSVSEREIGSMIADLRSVSIYKWVERAIGILVSGYVPLGKSDKVEFGPVNTLVSFNDVEGTRFRIGGVTTANLSKHWFSRGYVAYGTKDHKWKYSGEIEYSFNEKKRHAREFPVHSIRLRHKYDTDAVGQDYEFTNPDNIFLSLKRMKDTLMIYQRSTALEYTLELDNNFSVSASVSHIRQEATRYIPFRFSDGSMLSHLDFTPFTLTLRYAPGEKFMQTKSHRIPVNLDAPVFQISHTYAPGGKFGGCKYTVNKTEMSFQKRFWLSAFGYIDAIVKGGHVWSTSPFTALLIPNANLSYTIQPESFALMSPMEFITDSYAVFDMTYWANGAIFNYIPYLKKLKLREVFAFRGVWGHLSDKNNPRHNRWLPQFPIEANPVKMTSTPYMEISAGIDNIFRVLRVDYLWRLSYRNTPGVDKSGLRIALHFTF